MMIGQSDKGQWMAFFVVQVMGVGKANIYNVCYNAEQKAVNARDRLNSTNLTGYRWEVVMFSDWDQLDAHFTIKPEPEPPLEERMTRGLDQLIVPEHREKVQHIIDTLRSISYNSGWDDGREFTKKEFST